VLTDAIAMPQWDGMAATVSRYGNGRATGSLGGPVVFRKLIRIETGAQNRLIAGSNELTGYNIRTLPYFLGATVDLYRITEGRLQPVRRSTVIGGAIHRWVEISDRSAPKRGTRPAKDAPKKRSLVAEPGYTHGFSRFNRTGVPYWFAVAAVDADGNSGPKSAALAVVPQPQPTKGKGKGPDADARNRFLQGPAAGEEMARLAAPQALRAMADAQGPGLVRLSWDPVAGAAGYAVFLTYGDPASEIADAPYLDLSPDPAPLRPGDVAILSRKVLTHRPDEIHPRVWATPYWRAAVPAIVSNPQNDPAMGTEWRWMRFDAQDPRPRPHLGDWFLRRSLAPGAEIADGRAFHAGLTQNFYLILRPDRTYRWRARLRASRPVTATLRLAGGIPGTSFALTEDWQDCVHDFRVSKLETRKTPRDWRLSVAAGDADLTVDYCEIELGDTALPLFVDEFPIARGSFLRDQTQVIAGATTADADTMTNISGQGARITTLHTLRRICEEFGLKPWLQLEWHLPREDWLDIAAYLAAPVDSGHPMALKRAAQGHAAPWTEAFARLVLEFGNESWNRASSFWSFPAMAEADGTLIAPGDVYGLWCAMITQWLRESPFWPALEAKVEFLLGGWARNDYGTLAAARFPQARYVGIAAYNGGWDEGGRIAREEGGFFASMLSYAPLNGGRGFARLAENTRALAEAGRPAPIPAIYEAGPGYQLTGLNNSTISPAEILVQEVVMKSRGSGTATLDNLLLSASMGLWGANFYKIGRGDLWNSTTFNGTRDVDFAPYTLPRIVTEEIAPCTVHVVQPFRPLQHRLPDREGAMTTVDAAAIYALRSLADPTAWMLVFINRRIDPSLLDPADPAWRPDPQPAITLRLRTPWARVGGLVEWANTGNFREHNRYPPGQRLTAEGRFVPDPLCVAIDILPAAKDPPAEPSLLSVEVPAGGAILWKLTGVA
jgi:hypothetical protein